MKGSPMKRNFGVGASPAKQISKPMGGPGDVKREDSNLTTPNKQFRKGDYYDTRSAMKQRTNTEYTTTDDQGKETTQTVQTVPGRENKKGQSQASVMEMRWKKLEAASKAADAGIINRNGKQVTQEMFNNASEKQQAAMLKDQKALKDNAKFMKTQFQHSADSIGNVNQRLDDLPY